MTLRAFAVLLCLFPWPSAAAAADVEPGEILRQMIARYERMETCSAEMRIVDEITVPADKSQRIETTASIRLARPDRYRITWTSQEESGHPGREGAVWKSGEGPRLRVADRYFKMADDLEALSAATGVSHRASHTIPFLFFPSLSPQRLLDDLGGLRLLRREEVEGEPCYVLAGTSPASGEIVLWISEASRLLIRQSHSVRPGETSMPAMSDEELEQAIRKGGGEVTEELLQQVKMLQGLSRWLLKDSGFSFTTTATYSTIRIDEKLEPRDFVYPIPEGTVVSESLWSGLQESLAALRLPRPEPRQAPKPRPNLLAITLRKARADVPDTIRDRILAQALAIPGAQAAAILDSLPEGGQELRERRLWTERSPRHPQPVRLATRLISPGYFQVMDSGVIRGRPFVDRDDENSVPVAIVNESMAKKVWPGEDPIGRRFSLSPESPWLTVVGIVFDGSVPDVERPGESMVYLPITQALPARSSFVLLLRTEDDPRRTTPLLQELIVRNFARELRSEGLRIVSSAAD